MATCGTFPSEPKDGETRLDALKADLAKAQARCAKLHAAISFLEANPGAVALMDLAFGR